MSKDEAVEFERSEAFQSILKMRKWDEQAKDTTTKMEPLDKYRKMCFDFLSAV